MENNLHVFQGNEVIFREGALEQCMYDIRKGSVNIYANYGSEGEKLLVTLSAGQYFGEIALADLTARTATAVAAEDDTQLASITLENFFAYFCNDTDRVLAIMRNISARLRALTKDYIDVCQAIAEAAENASKGQEKNSGLKSRLSAIVKNYIKPIFTAPSVNYDIDSYIANNAGMADGVKRYACNQVIIHEGDDSPCMYDIKNGRVGVYTNYGKAGEKLLTELKMDQVFGEMGLIDNQPRSATVVALEDDTLVQVISAASFSAYMQEKPAKVMMIMRQLCSRLRALTADYLEACRCVSENVANEEKDPSGANKQWLKENLKRFINEYNQAMQYMAENPDMYTAAMHNYSNYPNY